MGRNKRRARRPFPIGAAFLVSAIAVVVLIILWPGEEQPVRKPVAEPESQPKPAESDVSLPQPQVDLQGRIDRLLRGYRLSVERRADGAGLVCTVPPGRSLFAVNGAVTRAVRLWGGEVVSGLEEGSSRQAIQVDLEIRSGSESCSVRLRRGGTPAEVGAVALILDDFGYLSGESLDPYLNLPFPYTPSVLPRLDRSTETVQRFVEAGMAPILHLPMEPIDAARFDPGPGAIRIGMSREEVTALVSAHLDEMEGIVGVSQHMGSRASADRQLVGPVLDRIGRRGLFYLDSMTSDSTVCPLEAAQRGVRYLTADLFLDGEPAPTGSTMEENLREAAELALTNGDAILVGHCRRSTLAFLPAAAESLAAWGCRFVRVEELLR